jgi:transmembrane sensor
VILADGVLRVERQTAAEEDVAWIGRQIILRDAPVTQVAAELVRWYGLELRVTDPTLRTRRLTATFEHAPREEIARVLAAALGGTSRLAGDTLWILPARLSPAHR